MCERCWKLAEDLFKDEAGYVLWEATSYPMGSYAEISRQARKLHRHVKTHLPYWRRRLYAEVNRQTEEMLTEASVKAM